MLVHSPKLWPWAIAPTIINIALLALMIYGFIHYYGTMYDWVSAHLGHITLANPDTWYWHILNGFLWVVDVIFQVFVVLISLILLLVVSYALGFVIAAPFNDALSERVETLATGVEPPPFLFKKFCADMIRIIRIEGIKAIILLLIPIVLFVLNIIPVIGAPLYVALTLTFGAWDLGFSFADLPMGRKVSPLRERWRFARENKWMLTGLGIGFIIPFFSLIFAAPMVVGGTLLYIDRENPLEK
jgi:uncharacterized protein involved in cysteine biosynthesis